MSSWITYISAIITQSRICLVMSSHVHLWDHMLGCSLVPRADVPVTPSLFSHSCVRLCRLVSNKPPHDELYPPCSISATFKVQILGLEIQIIREGRQRVASLFKASSTQPTSPDSGGHDTMLQRRALLHMHTLPNQSGKLMTRIGMN